MNRLAGRRPDKQTGGRQTDRQTGRPAGRQAGRLVSRSSKE